MATAVSQNEALAANRDEYLVEKPRVTRARLAASSLLGNATEITSPADLPNRPSSALPQQLHRPRYAPVVAP
jgi:hypothetical protein